MPIIFTNFKKRALRTMEEALPVSYLTVFFFLQRTMGKSKVFIKEERKESKDILPYPTAAFTGENPIAR